MQICSQPYFTANVNGEELLPLKLVVAPYIAVMEYLPAVFIAVVIFACRLLLFTVAAPKTALPALKVTVPAILPYAGVTVAVNENEVPCVTDAVDETRAVLVDEAWTVWVKIGELLAPSGL